MATTTHPPPTTLRHSNQTRKFTTLCQTAPARPETSLRLISSWKTHTHDTDVWLCFSPQVWATYFGTIHHNQRNATATRLAGFFFLLNRVKVETHGGLGGDPVETRGNLFGGWKIAERTLKSGGDKWVDSWLVTGFGFAYNFIWSYYIAILFFCQERDFCYYNF